MSFLKYIIIDAIIIANKQFPYLKLSLFKVHDCLKKRHFIVGLFESGPTGVHTPLICLQSLNHLMYPPLHSISLLMKLDHFQRISHI